MLDGEVPVSVQSGVVERCVSSAVHTVHIGTPPDTVDGGQRSTRTNKDTLRAYCTSKHVAASAVKQKTDSHREGEIWTNGKTARQTDWQAVRLVKVGAADTMLIAI